MNRVLVVDDELSIRESFSLILEGKYRVITTASGEGALKHVTDQKTDLVYLDIRMPGLDGLETLKRIKEIDPGVEVIMVTAVNDVKKASEAIKLGARDYLIKPFDVNAILKMTESILRRRSLRFEGETIQREAKKKAARLIGQSEKIGLIRKSIEDLSAKNLRVLILGEPGTEKETVVELIHEKGPRAELPLAYLPLSGKMSALEIKIKLFGAGGGLTTADLKRESGLLEEARGGTLFIDHIEFLPPDVLSAQTCDARLIAGSSQLELADKSKELFDLFSEAIFVLPPLRERISDLPLLVEYFLGKFNEQYGREIDDVSNEAMEIFSNYAWPGNTQELAVLLERLVIITNSNKISQKDLPLDLLLKSGEVHGSDYLSLFEKEYIQKIYKECGRDKEKLAALLEVNPALIEGKI